jgi:hypothetical protein
MLDIVFVASVNIDSRSLWSGCLIGLVECRVGERDVERGDENGECRME